MKVFVAGATGVLGWRAVRDLVGAGHHVTGVARTPEKAALLRRLGADAVTVDLFDAAAVADAVKGHDVVVNLATNIPPMTKAALPGAWSTNDRIRTEGSRNLVDAAIAAGAKRYVQESITFTYPDCGDAWIDETVEPERSRVFASVFAAEESAARFTDAGGVGVVLRFALFYGADSHHSVDSIRLAKMGLAPVVGAPDSFQSLITTDDAARAVVAALDAPAGTYNVADDEPLTRAEQASVISAAVQRRGRLLPRAAAKAGGAKSEYLGRSQRITNRRFKEATGWQPSTSSARQGWPSTVAAMDSPVLDGRSRFARVVLGLIAFSALGLGLMATFTPRAFYDDFPSGRGWVAADGPYNEHLVRDFGGMNLAMFVLTVFAIVRFTPALARAVAAAWLFFDVPHFVHHMRHLDVYDGADQAANVLTLGSGILLAVAVLVALRGAGQRMPVSQRTSTSV